MNWSCGLQFRVRSGGSRGVTFPIDSPVLKIGRARNPGERQPGWMRLSDDTVSRLHCELFWQEDRKCFRMLHRSATNSTYINGEIVEDAELFDGDLLEMGSTVLELQKADLRWSQADQKAVKDWPVRPHEMGAHEHSSEETRRIPGATVPVTRSRPKKMGLGPIAPFALIAEDGDCFLLNQNRVRLGGSTPPPEAPRKEGEEPLERPRFNSEYVVGDSFSYYNLILRYDELRMGYIAARLGPDAAEVAIARNSGGLIWRSSFPEGVEVPLEEGDMLCLGDLELQYLKVKPE